MAGSSTKRYKTYCGEYDAWYDKDTGEWLEGCDNPECIFCVDRPEVHPDDCWCSPEVSYKWQVINGLIENHW